MNNDAYLLPLAVAVPFMAGLVLLLGGHRLIPAFSKVLGWLGFLLPAVVAIYMWDFYFAEDAGVSGYKFYSTYETGLGAFGIHLAFGLNGISMPLFALAGLVGLAAGIHAMNSNVERKEAYTGLLLFIVSGVMGVFCTTDIFYLYFFHEFALIPTFILIGWWGRGTGARSAAMEMAIYLTLGAMLSLLGLIALYRQGGSQSFDIPTLQMTLAHMTIADWRQDRIFALLMFGFGILVSLWPFHSWAPDGYAAAPTPAAMLHAGVLKKFGLYALLQIAVPLLPEGMGYWSSTLAWLALGNVVIIGAVTIAQRDLKMMLGYSSVMHMGYIFLGIVCLNALGAGGAVLLMFAHGLSVAALFLLCDAVRERTGTHDMFAMGGLCQKAPVLSGFFVAATLAAAGLPGFANFWGEFSIFMALWRHSPLMSALAAFGIIISAIYGLRAASRIFFGEPTTSFQPLFDGSVKDIQPHERWPAILLLGALMFVGFCPSSISSGINESLPVIYNPSMISTKTVQTIPAKKPEAIVSITR